MSEINKIKYRVKRSEFIGFLHNCNSAEELGNILETYKRKFHDARHICYAVILNDNEIFNEDREPLGTSGTVMLNELKKRSLKNKLVIIVRYFGGIKLGKVLLRRTYLDVTVNILDKLLI